MYVETGEDAGQPLGMTVSPDKLLRLMEGIEAERSRLETWTHVNAQQLADLAAPGTDTCSADAVEVFAANGSQAVSMVKAYVLQLRNVVTELHAAAKSYGLVEDDNAETFRREFE